MSAATCWRGRHLNAPRCKSTETGDSRVGRCVPTRIPYPLLNTYTFLKDLRPLPTSSTSLNHDPVARPRADLT